MYGSEYRLTSSQHDHLGSTAPRIDLNQIGERIQLMTLSGQLHREVNKLADMFSGQKQQDNPGRLRVIYQQKEPLPGTTINTVLGRYQFYQLKEPTEITQEYFDLVLGFGSEGSDRKTLSFVRQTTSDPWEVQPRYRLSSFFDQANGEMNIGQKITVLREAVTALGQINDTTLPDRSKTAIELWRQEKAYQREKTILEKQLRQYAGEGFQKMRGFEMKDQFGKDLELTFKKEMDDYELIEYKTLTLNLNGVVIPLTSVDDRLYAGIVYDERFQEWGTKLKRTYLLRQVNTLVAQELELREALADLAGD